MVIVYRPYVSRWRRAWTVIKAKPPFWIKHYPEFFYGWCMVLTVGTISFGTKFYFAGWPNYYGCGWSNKPYYREYFEVRRPNDPAVLKWRLPEEYPADFVTNRQGNRFPTTGAKHYAWDVK
uniref:Uncharacterized protein n=1 Tax=Globodera rostochiensis TaxID=31243 RepID=A0A914HZ16_GLORO